MIAMTATSGSFRARPSIELLSDKALRSRLASELAKSDVKDELTDHAKEALKALDLAFKAKSLPDGLDLAITGSQGLSITALIGLTAKREGVQLPLASWGSGTRTDCSSYDCRTKSGRSSDHARRRSRTGA